MGHPRSGKWRPMEKGKGASGDDGEKNQKRKGRTRSDTNDLFPSVSRTTVKGEKKLRRTGERKEQREKIYDSVLFFLLPFPEIRSRSTLAGGKDDREENTPRFLCFLVTLINPATQQRSNPEKTPEKEEKEKEGKGGSAGPALLSISSRAALKRMGGWETELEKRGMGQRRTTPLITSRNR